jgi:hypothetical protein
MTGCPHDNMIDYTVCLGYFQRIQMHWEPLSMLEPFSELNIHSMGEAYKYSSFGPLGYDAML